MHPQNVSMCNASILFAFNLQTKFDMFCFVRSELEVCMGMGKTGIPWVPWDSHGNGSKISHGMGMGIKCMGMGVKTWELSPATVNSLLFLHSNME